MNKSIRPLLVIVSFLCIGSPGKAAVLTYGFSGQTFDSPIATIFSPTTFTGHVTWDTSTLDSFGAILDLGGYRYDVPYGPVGMSLTTSNGLTFANSSTASSAFEVGVLVKGSTYFQDEIRFNTPRATLPAGWTAQNAFMTMTLKGALDGSWLGGSDAIPTSLPTFDLWNSNDLPSQLYGPPIISLALYNASILGQSESLMSIQFSVFSLALIGSSDSQTVGANNAPSQINLAGGTGIGGGLTVELPANTGGQLSANYSVLPIGELPPSFSSANFLLDAPGDRLQFWDLDFTGTFTGPASLTFRFDPTLLASTDDLGVWHLKDGFGWEFLGGTINGDTITVQTDSFSPFALAKGPAGATATPEPASLAMWGFAGLGAAVAARRRSRQGRSSECRIAAVGR